MSDENVNSIQEILNERTARERRYQLLNAAAILMRNTGPGSVQWFVAQAEELLKEIEKREQSRKESTL